MGNQEMKAKAIQWEQAKLILKDYSQALTTNSIKHYLAINPSGGIGSLYDAHKDEFLSLPKLDIPSLTFTPTEVHNKPAVDTVPLGANNLSNIVRIPKEFCLSVHLNLVESHGICLLLKQPFIIDKYTRCLFYYYPTKKMHFDPEQYSKPSKIVSKSTVTNTATHVVTDIQYGIHVIIILQLSPNYEHELDRVIEKMKTKLIIKTFSIDASDNHLLEHFTDINVFSNIFDTTKPPNLISVFQRIIELISNINEHPPLECTLQPIRFFFSSYSQGKDIYYSLKEEYRNQLITYLDQLAILRKQLKTPLDLESKNLSKKYLKQHLDEVEQNISEIENLYQHRRQELAYLVRKVRTGETKEEAVNRLMINNEDHQLLEETGQTNMRLTALKDKVQLIKRLEKQAIKYMNAKELVEDNDHDWERISQQLIRDDNQSHIFCFDDKLAKISSSEWSNWYEKMIKTKKSDSQLKVVYADFSYCSFQLKQMEVLLPKSIHKQQKTSSLAASSNSTVPSSPSKPVASTSQIQPSASKSTASNSKVKQATTDSGPIASNPASSTSKTKTSPQRITKSTSKITPVTSQQPISNSTSTGSKQISSPSKPPQATTSTSKTAPTASQTTLPAQKPTSSEQTNASPIKYINVLLLGASGVGKSTFVNAIVNYLHFTSLEEACSSQPIVLMPVSFLITTGHNFDERIVSFGQEDSNENHNNIGQSVTQHCRSYAFTIGTQTKLRLIDTPGMGDTRGHEQDDRNMHHILSFINNLSHLNAICILLKPNESKLNVVFRSYFTRLIGFLGEHARQNIIFCFTNTRSTFFAPGDTAPLLKKMLNAHPIKNIPFEKANSFCFDNEAFRYLVARLNGLDFDDYLKEEYKRSWTKSVDESNRLLGRILNDVIAYTQEEWQSVEHIHFQITQLARPMLEALRNTLRNSILVKNRFANALVELKPTYVQRNSTICLHCRSLERVGEFFVLSDKVHIYSNRCGTCSCDSQRHLKIDYVLEYGTWTDTSSTPLQNFQTNLCILKQTMEDLIHILTNVIRISAENDAILCGLDRLIAEETYICSQKGTNKLNSLLLNELQNVRKDYRKMWTSSTSTPRSIELSDAYKHIQGIISRSTSIRKQIDAIKQTQQLQMQEDEKCIS